MTLDELKKLLQFPENEHVEYKEAQTQYDLKKLMKYCVAFANEKGGKLIFGVNDHRKIVGTQIFKNIEKIKSDIFDKVHIVVNIFELQEGNKRVLVFDILSRPPSTPVDYEGAYFMRIGEETRTMSAEKLRGIFEEGQSEFESQLALQNITGEQVVLLLDVQSYFDLMNLPLPKTQEAILDRFIREKLVSTDDLSYSITNMGAILFAKDVNKFEWIARKAVRLVVYDGNGKLNTKQDITGIKGYAVAFQSLIEFIMGQIPTQEVIMDDGLRQKKREYPKLSIRELVANALIHQDFKSRGNNVMIEIYDNRIEISNPGKPVIPADRFIDDYQSRNEKLANLMRRLHICEEKGSGIDKALIAIEAQKLPALDIQVTETRTIVRMSALKDFKELSKSEKIQACYQHCCLKYVMGDFMTNQSFRERWGSLDSKARRDAVSLIIIATLEKKMIQLNDPNSQSKRYAKYTPFWS